MAAVAATILLGYSAYVLSAEVKYEHPDLTIVAKDEPLASVLKSLGREMRIFITVPSGLNPTVNADIQQQPIKQALKTLLADMSYSLEWEEGGERLAGLTIFGSNAPAVAGASPARNTAYPAVAPTAPDSTAAEQLAPPSPGSGGNVPPEVEANAMEHAMEMEATMVEHEARMAEEREAQEAEMALRREQEDIEQEARMKEEAARHEAEMRAYIESQGLKYPH